MNLLFVCVGGAVGAVCRYMLGILLAKRFLRPTFPVAILFINILGSCGLGLFYGLYYEVIPLYGYGEPIYLLIAVGFFGAFTTFSSFSMEAVQFIENKQWRMLLVYSGLTIIGSISMFMLMFNLTR